MSLRELAAADHRLIVEDVAGGFGRELTFVDPDGRTAVINGYWNDIAQQVDLQSGSMIGGRVAFVRVTNGALRTAGLSLPYGEHDTAKKPWLVMYTALSGRPQKFKISEARPDKSIDAVDCYLEAFK